MGNKLKEEDSRKKTTKNEKAKKERLDLGRKLSRIFSRNEDLVKRELSVAGKHLTVFFFESLVDKNLINEAIIAPLLATKNLPEENKVDFLIENVLLAVDAEKKTKPKEAENAILAGATVVVFSDETSFVQFSTQGYPKRAIIEPPSSAVIKGPREGFTEDLNTNISLLRRRIKTSKLVVKFKTLGRVTATTVAVMFLSNIADPSVVAEIEQKLKKIDIDGIVDSYYIQEYSEKNKNSIFKQIGSSEKPDIVTAKMLEGRIAVLMDGSPIVLTIPFLLIEDIQSSDDYYNHPVHATFVRIIRVFGILLGVLLPGLYVATQIFHYRILPINFLISLMDAVQGISFPPLVEILFVLFLFEILNEASVRMPKYLGMALSIIGAIILGETAVEAGLISPPTILVVAISGITIYTVPDQTATTSLLRLIFTIIGGLVGFYGLMIASVFTIAYMAGIENYGAPYLAPYGPRIKEDQKDGIIKANLEEMVERPRSFPNKNRVRIKK